MLRRTTYHYRRRIPLSLTPFINTKFYFRSLSKDLKLALSISSKIDGIFDDLLVMVKLGIKPDISKLGIKILEPYPTDSFLKMVDRSDNAQKTTQMHIELLLQLLPKDISLISQSKVDMIIDDIKHLPKRNIQKYKSKQVSELLKMDIPSDHHLGSRGVNGYLKTLKSFFDFCYKREYISRQFDIPLMKSQINSRDERQSLSKNTIIELINNSRSDELSSAYTILYLSGMRLSEAYKCKITMIDGVRCFDLTDRSIKLKTKSSYRLIPVHESIIAPESQLDDMRTLKPDYIVKQCTKNLQNGTLYSLRHSFATDLASNGVEPHIISELMGHKHETITLGRYVKGFPVSMVKDAIDNLEL